MVVHWAYWFLYSVFISTNRIGSVGILLLIWNMISLTANKGGKNDYYKTSIWRKALIIDWNAPHINCSDYRFERDLCVDRWWTPLIVAMLRVTLSEAVASGTTISGDRGSCGTKQWQDLTHRGAVCWSAKDRSASVQKLKPFSMPVRLFVSHASSKRYKAIWGKTF